MFEQDKKEMVIRYSAIGFVLGIVLTVIEYALLLYSREIPFSFSAIALLHHTHAAVYLIDFLAIPGLFFGALIGNWRHKQLDSLSEKIRQETGKNEEIKRFTHALIADDLNTDVSLTHIEQSLSDKLHELKDTLSRNREMERQRRLDERQRNWISEGLAEFGDILRKHSMEIETMTY